MNIITSLTVLLALAGCHANEGDVPAEAPRALSTPAVSAGAEYRHLFAASKFDIGDSAQTEGGPLFERLSGSRGAFFTDKLTGATWGVASATSTVRSKLDLSTLPASDVTQPTLALGFTESEDTHNAMVYDYFAKRGIPMGEVGGMHVTTTMGGSSNGSLSPSHSKFLWHTSHLERKLSGIRVDGSYAFAAFGRSGAVISEGVYWPAIPVQVVTEAVALAKKVSSKAERADLLTKMRKADPDLDETQAEVAIIHTGPSFHSAFEARAVYATLSTGHGKRRVLRYDGAGSKVSLADEGAGGGQGSSKLR